MNRILLPALLAGSLTTLGCAGVSRDYVAANAATIHTNSESTLATLEAMCRPAPGAEPAPEPAAAGPELCSIEKPALEALKDDQRQSRDRAKELCDRAESDCKPTEVP